MANVLLTGGTGLVGSYLQKKLEAKNHNVLILTRAPRKDNHFRWSTEINCMDEQVFQNLDYIIHLAGAGIADKRWTKARKEELIKSRVDSVNLLLSRAKKLGVSLKGFISSSGIGYYGAQTTETIFTETSEPANDFIAQICVQWEKAAKTFTELNTPVTILRTGVVLSEDGGALEKMNTPLFLSALGNGKQYIPWIHIEDLCNLYVKAIEDSEFAGQTYNAVAPDWQTNTSFTKTLGMVLKKPTTPFNVPGFVLKTILGELANIVLKGSRVSAEKTAKNYNFVYTKLNKALENIYSSS